MRRSSAFISLGLSAGLLFSLAACAPGGTAPADGECVPSGAASDAVTVDGAFGSVPAIAFDGPLTAEATQRTVLEQGDGDVASNGDTVVIEYTVLNGETGDEIASTGLRVTTPNGSPSTRQASSSSASRSCLTARRLARDWPASSRPSRGSATRACPSWA